jgi:hypothetical protein
MDMIENGDAINLSTGTLTSFIEFAKLATSACGYSPTVGVPPIVQKGFSRAVVIHQSRLNWVSSLK